MKVYAANASMQNQVLNYRILENPSMLTQHVPSGRQIQIAPRDMNKLQVDDFFQQMRKYGLVTVEEARLHKSNTPIVWIANIDAPVPEDIIRRTLDLNTGVITMIGREQRRLAALATSHNMTEQARTPHAAGNFEMSVEEVGKAGDEANPSLMGEGIHVTTEPGAGPGRDQSGSGRRGTGGNRGRKKAA